MVLFAALLVGRRWERAVSGVLGSAVSTSAFTSGHLAPAHLAVDHGEVFKSFMHAYLPDWQAREHNLRQLERDMLKVAEKKNITKTTKGY